MNGQPRSRRLFAWMTLPVSAIGFVVWMFWPVVRSHSQEASEEPASEVAVVEPIQIEAISAERRSLSMQAAATGYLEPWREVEVAVEIGGKVTWHGLREGDRVAEGQKLLQMDPRDSRIALVEAEAELLRAQASFAVSYAATPESPDPADPTRAARPEPRSRDLAYDEAVRLFDQGLISERDLAKARRQRDAGALLRGDQRAEVQAVTSGLAQAEQGVERATLNLQRTAVRSPFSGRVADLDIEVGQQLTAGQRCFSLLDESRVKVEAEVLETYVVRLRPGAPARVRIPALDDASFTGRVHAINPRISSESGTGRVTIVIDNPEGQLLAGLFAYVEIETGLLEDRLVLPAASVLNREGRPLVFRVVDGRALWTYVRLGPRSGDWIVVEDGVSEGDVVATGGHFALAHESPVQVAPEKVARRNDTSRNDTPRNDTSRNDTRNDGVGSERSSS